MSERPDQVSFRRQHPAAGRSTIDGPGPPWRTRPTGAPATFTPWFGALAHAIFFRAGSLDYFHTHVCSAGMPGCTSVLGTVRVTGTATRPGQLRVGVLLPVPGTWRMFLQTKADGRVLTAPFTLTVR